MIAILIDFNGTLSNDKFWHSLPNAQSRRVDRFLFKNNRDLVRKWMRGRVTSEQIIRVVSENCQIPTDRLEASLRRDCLEMKIDQDILDELCALRRSHTLFLVTGNMDCFKTFTVAAQQLYQHFDQIIISSEVGILKTDELFINWFETRYGILASDCYLIDDDIHSGLAFLRGGGNFVQVRSPAETLAYLRAIRRSDASEAI